MQYLQKTTFSNSELLKHTDQMLKKNNSNFALSISALFYLLIWLIVTTKH